jgi:hypothetical protein
MKVTARSSYTDNLGSISFVLHGSLVAALPCSVAAVEPHIRPVDILRRVLAQKRHDIRHLLRLGKLACRDRAQVSKRPR